MHRYEDFVKNSVPGKMLELVVVKRYTEGAPLKICIECTVEKILHDNNRATALRTNKGDLTLGNAKLVLAMGTLPPTTLMLNSFPKADFPLIANMGKRFTAHFISSIIARVPRKSFPNVSNFGDLEIAAIYVAGVDKTSGMQFHIQLSAVSSTTPTKSLSDTFHHLPDVLAAPSYEQLSESKDDIIFVCGCVGQLDHNNPRNWFQLLNDFDDITCNATLQVLANDTDNKLWDVMDSTTFKLLEEELIPHGDVLEYWHPEDDSGTWKESRPTNNSGTWKKSRPPSSMIRVPGLVHEASTMWIGDNVEAPVGLDYRPKGIENVYITGGSLWPTGGSWNPTATMVSLATHLADTLEPKSQ